MIDPISFVVKFIFDFWWLILPSLLLQIWWEKFRDGKKMDYRRKMKWSFMEIIFPPGITKTPRAMEDIFSALHTIAADPSTDWTWWNKNINGFIPPSFCFLLIAHNSKLKFYLRFPAELKDFVKSRFYIHYSEIKLVDSEDPLKVLPFRTPNSLFDVDIFNVVLEKEDSYPIKTYLDTEKLPKEQQIDSLSTFSEGAHQISDKEWIVFQIFILPVSSEDKENGKKWVERGQKLINKIIKKEEAKEITLQEEIGEFIKNLLIAPFKPISWKSAEKKENEFNIQKLTPLERKSVELIQSKIRKLGFLCNIRTFYLATHDIYPLKRDSAISLIISVFKNFNSEEGNSFLVLPITKVRRPLRKTKYLALENFDVFILKNIEYFYTRIYRLPDLPRQINLAKNFILNTEELASLIHPPMEVIPEITIERLPVTEKPPPSKIPLVEL